MNVSMFIELDVFQWSRPDAENPRLSAPITDSETTLLVTHPPLDADGKIVANAFIMGAQNEKGYVESIYVPANAVQGYGNVPDSTNLGLTITGVTRGINLSGLDIDTAVSGLAVAHNTNSVIFNNVSAINFTMMRSALMGQIGSGGNVWKIGDETDVDSKIYAFNGDADEPYWGYGSASDGWIFSNDGVNSTPFGTGAGVTSGDGIATIVAGLIKMDLATDSGLEFDSGDVRVDRGVVQNNSWIYGEPSGGTDDYAYDCTPAITAYASGQRYIFKADVANTGEATLNINSLGAKDIKRNHDQVLITDDIEVGQIVECIYDGTNMQMVSPIATTEIPLKVGGDTWSVSANGQTKVITHNLGKVPQVITITFGGQDNNSVNGEALAHGIYDGTNYSCIYKNDAQKMYFKDTSNIIKVMQPTNNWSATVTDNSINSFTLTSNSYIGSGDIMFNWRVE